jgi:hypothetical protein
VSRTDALTAARALLGDVLALLAHAEADTPQGDTPAIPPAPPRPFTLCERDLLAVVRSSGCRLTMPQIRARLDQRGQLHGESTLLRALARLVRVGHLTNAHDRRGYAVPDAAPAEGRVAA